MNTMDSSSYEMNNNQRYHPYYRAKNSTTTNERDFLDNDNRRDYRSRRYDRSNNNNNNNSNYTDFSYRRSDHRYRHKTPPRKPQHTYFASPPVANDKRLPPPRPLMPPQPPPLPPPPPPLLSVVPHERESWIRSVKKTKMNESTEQKTQYLETMLRMPQQSKTAFNSSMFDRLRFADDQPLTTTTTTTTMITTTTTTTNNNNNTNNNTIELDRGSFHLIDDINNHEDIRALEQILFENELREQSHQALPTPPPSIIECEPTLPSSPKLPSPPPFSGFLIDNCDDEIELPPLSPPRHTSERRDPLEMAEERREMLLNELADADAERRQELKRQKRLRHRQALHQKEGKQKKKNEIQQETSTETKIEQPTPPVEEPEQEEDDEEVQQSADWIIEHDIIGTDRISALTEEVQRTVITDENRRAKVNVILDKIKKHQDELRKLRQYVMSIFDIEQSQRTTSTKTRQQTSNINQDLLMALLNQSTMSGCWLCSGKMYAEVATQCDHVDER